MIAITIAVGAKYEAAAKLAVDSCEKMTGLRAFTLRNTGACPPAKFKLCLLELLPLETILYFDADARFLRPWDPHQYEDSPAVVTVLDWPSAARNVDCDAFGIDRNRYFASGFWIANARHHAAAWAAARKIAFAPDYRTAFKYEQTALNAAVQRAELPVTNLDRRYWWIPTRDHPAPPDVVTVARGGDAPEDQIAYDEAVRNLQAEIVSFDAKAEPGVDVVGDAEQLCMFLAGRRFHGIICTSLLEHVRRPWRVARQCYRALLGGGRIFVSAPWVYPDHHDPIDCYRFSPLGLRSLCVDAGFRCLADGERPEGRNRISFFVGEKPCPISLMA